MIQLPIYIGHNRRTTMHIRKPALVILAVLTLIPVLCLAPAASAQSTTPLNTVVITSAGGQTIHPRDNVTVAFQASIADPNSISNTVSVSGPVLKVSVKCPTGGSQNFAISAPPASIDIPGNSSSFFPSTPVTAQGAAPSNLCGGRAGVVNGLTFTATSGLTCHANSAQGCCHTVCVKTPNPNSNSCKPFKSCVSGQNGGCCKT